MPLRELESASSIFISTNLPRIFGFWKWKFTTLLHSVLDDEIGVFVGRHGKCFFSRIDKYQPDTLIIQNFTYYNDCNTIRDFEKGKGMKRLMNTLIRYTKENYSEIKQLQLDDEAVLLCESKIDNSIYRIYLPRLYFLKYGMGYYQYNFGFKLMNKRFNMILQDNKQKLENFKLVKDNLYTIYQFLKYEYMQLNLD